MDQWKVDTLDDKILMHGSRCQSGWCTTITHTSQYIFVFPRNGEGIIDIAVTAFLVLEEQRRVIECSEFYKAVVIVSVNAPVGYCCGEV